MDAIELDRSLLITAVWAVLGVWIGVGIAVTMVGVSLFGLLLGLVLAGVIGLVGSRTSKQVVDVH